MNLDHVIAAVFGLWDLLLPADRIHSHERQLLLPIKGPRKSGPVADAVLKKTADEAG
jgi:hypothetical protein